jgi:hypothetical protein
LAGANLPDVAPLPVPPTGAYAMRPTCLSPAANGRAGLLEFDMQIRDLTIDCQTDAPQCKNLRPHGLTVIAVGEDAIPLATTARVLAPVSIPAGRVKVADDAAPGDTDMDDMPDVRAYVTSPVALFLMRTSGKFVALW